MQTSLLIAKDFTVALNGEVKIEYVNSPAFPKPQICIIAEKVMLYTSAGNVFDMPLGVLDSVVPKLPASPAWMERLYSTELGR